MARESLVEYITTGSVLDLNRLQSDIIAAHSNVRNIIKTGNDIHIRSTTELTAQEKADIDSLIAAFVDSDPEQQVPAIYDLAKTGYSKHFHAIDYKTELTQSLIPKRTAIKGEVSQVVWYKDLDQDNNPVNPVIKVDVNYTRDASGFALYRTTTRTWLNRDGSDNPQTKVTTKYYFVNSVDQIQEGIKRRKLLVDNIQVPVLGMVMEVLMPLGFSQEACLLRGRAFMDDYEQEFNKFIDNSSTITNPADPDYGMKAVRVKLRDESNPDHIQWLDKAPGALGGQTTIRQYIMGEFDI